jgi:glucosylceramidase
VSFFGLHAKIAKPNMHPPPSRRDFLQISAMGLAAAVASEIAPPLAAAAPTSPPGDITVWITAGEKRFAPAPKISWSPSSDRAGDVIELDPSKKYQEILGFGGAFTDASCYLFVQLTPAAREQLLHELFHASQMGLNVCRTCIGSSDYSTKLYSFDDGDPDPELSRFSIAHDREYIVPVLRQARELNPDLFLFSSPWSPPGWMKFNNSMLGGSMRRKYLATYAEYFLKFIQGYAAEGVPIQAVTSQNEVDTDQDGRMPACIWPQEYEIEFVGNHLGPLFEHAGVTTRIWILDHNYNLWGRSLSELEDAPLRKYANAVAWHGYVGTPEMMSRVHDTYPDMEMYWTEGGPDYTDPAYGTDWTKWSTIFTRVLRNWCRSITTWNLVLDESGKPNLGPFSCGGLVTLHSQTKQILHSGQYCALAHYSRVLRRGARRFDSRSSAEKVEHVALENSDGEKLLIITNSGSSRTLRLDFLENSAQVSLPADSVSTLLWH